MNIFYKLKNFRTFDENGAEIEIAPITILTGCNSSGKSSVTKSLLLLGEFCKKLTKSKVINPSSRIIFDNAKIDFQQMNRLSLGTFDNKKLEKCYFMVFLQKVGNFSKIYYNYGNKEIGTV